MYVRISIQTNKIQDKNKGTPALTTTVNRSQVRNVTHCNLGKLPVKTLIP